jgi:hypothetical protein
LAGVDLESLAEAFLLLASFERRRLRLDVADEDLLGCQFWEIH